jgi:hypothetical protein
MTDQIIKDMNVEDIILTNKKQTPKTPSYTLKAIKAYEEKNKEKLKEYRKKYYKDKRERLKQNNETTKTQIETLKQQMSELAEKLASLEAVVSK